MPPLGVAYLASYLERDGATVKIIDANAERLTFQDLKERFKDEEPRFVGITATTPLMENALHIASLCKDLFPEVRVIMGGVHPTILPDEVLQHKHVDFVVRGEGEETIRELVKGKDQESVMGISYRKDGAVVHNPDRPLIKSLDEIPLPAYHLLPMKRYFPAMGGYKRLPGTSLMAGRGCPGKCTFCYKCFGNTLRWRSPQNILDEIKLLISTYGIREASFYDDTFTMYKKKTMELCELLLKDRIDLTWSCFSRIDFVTPELLSLMKRAGCHQIMYGIESADPEILKNIRKNVSLEKAEEAVRMTNEAGIDSRLAFMIGNPGETEETMERTLQYAIRLSPALVIFNITTPYPGTEMFAWARESGYLRTEDWSQYDLSTVVMELPTISSEAILKFYRTVHRRFYLRASYLVRRAFKMRTLDDLKMNFSTFLSLLPGSGFSRATRQAG